jgi:hypothetical protein
VQIAAQGLNGPCWRSAFCSNGRQGKVDARPLAQLTHPRDSNQEESMRTKLIRRRAALLAAAGAALSTIVSTQHLAADTWNYVGPQNGAWGSPGNWYDTNTDSNGLPGASDTAEISNPVTSPTLGAHVNLNIDATVDSLIVDNDGGISYAEVDQLTNTLTAETEDIGLYGLGSYSLSGGTNTTAVENIGANGTGEYIQTGGINTFFTMGIGENPGSDGSYALDGGTLTGTGSYNKPGFSIEVGGFDGITGGTGLFNQQAGRLRMSMLSPFIVRGPTRWVAAFLNSTP